MARDLYRVFSHFQTALSRSRFPLGIPLRKTSINISYSICIFLGGSLAMFSFFSWNRYTSAPMNIMLYIIIHRIICIRLYLIIYYHLCINIWFILLWMYQSVISYLNKHIHYPITIFRILSKWNTYLTRSCLTIIIC